MIPPHMQHRFQKPPVTRRAPGACAKTSYVAYEDKKGSFFMKEEVRQLNGSGKVPSFRGNPYGSYFCPNGGMSGYNNYGCNPNNGGYGFGSMSGFGSMNGGGWNGGLEPPPLVHKFFSSRRDEMGVGSRNKMLSNQFPMSFIRPGYGSMFAMPSSHRLECNSSFINIADNNVRSSEEGLYVASESHVDKCLTRAPAEKSYEHSAKEESSPSNGKGAEPSSKPTTLSVNTVVEAPKPVEPVTKNNRSVAEKPKQIEKPKNDNEAKGKVDSGVLPGPNDKSGLQAIPISQDVNEAVHKPARVGDVFGGGENNLKTSKPAEETSRSYSRSMRRRSPYRVRNTSVINMSIPEIPVANEVLDTLDDEILQSKRSFGSGTIKTQRYGQSTDHIDRRRSMRSKYSERNQPEGENRNEPSSSLKDRKVSEGELRAKRLVDQYNALEGQIPTNAHSDNNCGIEKSDGAKANKAAVTQSTGKNSRDSDARQFSSQKEEEERDEEHQSHGDSKSNAVKTLVVLEKHPRGSVRISAAGDTFTFGGAIHKANEVVLREAGSMSYHSELLTEVKDAVCNGYNASIISVEGPNSGGLFRSPVWSGLSRVVRGVLQKNQGASDCVVELTAALGFIHKDKVRDLFDEKSTTFETLQVHPSPIYGPRIPQLRYGKITSARAFEEAVESALSRASSDSVLCCTDGVLIALLLSKQSRVITNELGEKTCDVFLSSLVVASTGSDVMPFESALSRVKNEYSMIFHLVLGGPCHTCFMLNLSMGVKEDEKETVEKLIELQNKMHSFNNYPLRSGSVTRFVKYVESANKEGRERLTQEENPEKRSKLERYVQEQMRLLADAKKMLDEASEEFRGLL